MTRGPSAPCCLAPPRPHKARVRHEPELLAPVRKIMSGALHPMRPEGGSAVDRCWRMHAARARRGPQHQPIGDPAPTRATTAGGLAAPHRPAHPVCCTVLTALPLLTIPNTSLTHNPSSATAVGGCTATGGMHITHSMRAHMQPAHHTQHASATGGLRITHSMLPLTSACTTCRCARMRASAAGPSVKPCAAWPS